MDKFSFLNAVHTQYVEDLYQKYLHFPDSIEPSWKAFFQGYDFAKESYNGNSIQEDEFSQIIPEDLKKEFKVINLIDAYRTRGHLFTKTNPVRERRTYVPTLALENFGLSELDLEKTFNAGEILGIGGATTLENIVTHLEQIYCESIGIEYMYIRNPEILKWIQNWINQNINHAQLKVEEKQQILHKLTEAVAFENFLHTKFVGQKRFSLEGGETLIPALDELISRSASLGVEEVVVGMSHRGRLNVLANIFKKSYAQIFTEFEGKDYEEAIFSGDVKYHLGSTNFIDYKEDRKIKINLAPNPSHLETVDAIVQGIVRAKADDDYQNDYHKILPILIHGDAAVAAQGIVYEVIQMMDLDGYKTGGTVHIVVNNQIGFTTNYLDGRSSTYCTDIAKVTLSPVLHVNADDAEAVVHAIRFAADFRAQFQRDVFIDLLGYRKYGHNEGDEPRFTQPKLYKEIAKHKNPREIYKEKLIKENIIDENLIIESEKEYRKILEQDFDIAKTNEKTRLEPFMKEEWQNYLPANFNDLLLSINTKFPINNLKDIAQKITKIPEDKNLFNKIKRLLQQRWEMVENDKLDWAMGELLSYATLVYEGHNVRLSGEDVKRGTFSHRHAYIKTEDTEEEIGLLDNISDKNWFVAYNSLLSEYGVMGFDYGYAMAAPNTLTIWEAQFGDFVNGAQIIIDQYISAAEDKWKMQNGLVLLLPHGFEGQGAEHSSGRMERFLQLCANGNMFIANCTTPANFFHILRRQIKANYRKPLVIFTPKSLLRHPKVTSTLEELAEGNFQEIIDDNTANPEKITRVIFCSGKFYYDLLQKKEELQDEKVALVRIEQLYPLNMEKIYEILDKYYNKVEFIWAQEEPENMGAWCYMMRKLRKLEIELISPPESGSPSPGSHERYHKIQHHIIEQVFQNLK